MTPRAEYRVPFPGGSNRSPDRDHGAPSMRASSTSCTSNKAVLFPDHLLMLRDGARPGASPIALARAYNAGCTSAGCSRSRSLKGALVVAPQDPEAGAADIRRHAGHRGVRAASTCRPPGVKPLYGHRAVRPDLRGRPPRPACRSRSTRSRRCSRSSRSSSNEFRTTLGAHAVAHPFSMIANIVSMLETGVPVRFPELRIAFMEAGCGWVPFIAAPARQGVHRAPARGAVPPGAAEPLHQAFFYGTQPIEEPERLGDIVKLYELFDGENQAMFASDWPHHDFDHPQHFFGLPFSRRGAAEDHGRERGPLLR